MTNTLASSVQTLKSILRVARKSRFGRALKGSAEHTDIIVMGNGPSFKADVAADPGFFLERPCLCVNDFPKTEYFTRLRPRYFLLLDPCYWDGETSAALVGFREAVFASVLEKCDWELTVLIPIEAKGHFPETLFASKPNIKLSFFNNTPIWGFEPVLHYLTEKELGMAPAYNVFIAALVVGINLGYKRVFLFGGDHSWHQNLWVSRDNVVSIKQSHFYDTEEPDLVPFYCDTAETKTFRVHEIFQRWSKVFLGYEEVRRYAERRKVEILNGSSVTFIDAFKRFSLKSGAGRVSGNG